MVAIVITLIAIVMIIQSIIRAHQESTPVEKLTTERNYNSVENRITYDFTAQTEEDLDPT